MWEKYWENEKASTFQIFRPLARGQIKGLDPMLACTRAALPTGRRACNRCLQLLASRIARTFALCACAASHRSVVDGPSPSREAASCALRPHGVQFQAYSSLGTQHRARVNPVLNHPIIKALSRSTGRSEAQVVLRWVLQHGVAIIPRSMRQHHIEANLRLVDFELSSDDMAQIDALDGTDPSLAVPSPPPMGCANEHPSCESWAAAGECENNPDYMRQACAGSCGTCSERKIEL